MVTTLADLGVGDAFVLLARVTALDQVTGMTVTFFGPDRAPQGQLVISPTGVLSGQLATAPAATPVHPVTQFRAVSVGSVLVSRGTGETMVARKVRIMGDGSYQWASSLPGGVWYTTDDWQVVGSVTLQ
jgi:hypothetical protein